LDLSLIDAEGYPRYTFGMAKDTTPSTEVTWESAREVWSTAKVELPRELNEASRKYLTELDRTLTKFRTAASIAETDRSRDWAFSEVADQCRDLHNILDGIDEAAFSRVAGAALTRADQLLPEAVVCLEHLEIAFRRARSPKIPRKRTHEQNYILVTLLAGVFDEMTDLRATVTYNPYRGTREGRFVAFVHAFIAQFLPNHEPIPNGRAIERILITRRKIPDPLR